MRKKIEKYLSSKEKKVYSNLDKILTMYLNGEIKRMLFLYEGVSVCPSFRKDNTAIQISYNFNNIYVVMEFFEDKYNVAVYHAGIDSDDLDKLFIDHAYPEDFNLKELVEEVDIKIKNHPKLKDTVSIKKKKQYSLIARISLCLPIIICGSIGLYCVVTKSAVQGNAWWGVVFIVIPLIIWFVFDVKSKRIK